MDRCSWFSNYNDTHILHVPTKRKLHLCSKWVDVHGVFRKGIDIDESDLWKV